MNKNEIEVYKKIYDEFAEYMRLQGQLIPVSQTVFLESVCHKANCVDMKPWEEFSDSDYVDVAYLELLRRFPFELDKEYWLHEPDNRKRLTETIMESGEFANLHISVSNNPYPIDERKLRRRRKLYGSSFEQLSHTWYYRLYMKLPADVRRILKRAAGI